MFENSVILSLICFTLWGIADLFYKKGNPNEERFSDIKTGVVVGIVMGIHAIIYYFSNNLSVSFSEIIKYLPISLFYISSMVIGYKGLKYIELSISSPVQNNGSVIVSILLIIIFKEKYPWIAYLAFFLMYVSTYWLYLIERKANKEERKVSITKDKKVKMLAIVLPIVYCILDGLGTFLDAVYLDKMEIISEENALVAYELTFLLFAICAIFFLWRKHEKLNIFSEKNRLLAAIFETGGQYFYNFAMGGDSTLASTIVGSYCILSMILSRIFLKEGLSKSQYAALFIGVVGLVILSALGI